MPRIEPKHTILAMDLSLNGSGFAVLQTFNRSVKILNLLEVDNSKLQTNQLHEKLANIYFNLDDLLDAYEITDFVREKGFTRHNQVTQKLFRVVGITEFTLYCHGITSLIPELAPTTVKKCLTGNGKADKIEVQQAINKYLARSQQGKITFESDNLSDAVAIGITYAIKNKLIKV